MQPLIVAAVGNRHFGEPAAGARLAAASQAAFAAVTNASIKGCDFFPRGASTPLATSIAQVAVRVIASATVSGVSPPANPQVAARP